MVELRLADHGPTYPRDRSMNMAVAQIGWVGHTGTVYPLRDGPTQQEEPGGFTPLLIPTGTWVDLGDGRWGISD